MHSTMYHLLEQSSNVIGVIGVVLQLVVYYLLSINRLQAQAFSYSFCNMLGAAFILFSLCFHWNLASALVEAVWFLISARMVLKKNPINIAVGFTKIAYPPLSIIFPAILK